MYRLKGVCFALISSATFGLVPLFTLPLMIDKLRPIDSLAIGVPTILFYRFLFSSITMAGVCAVKKTSLRIKFKDLIVILILSLLYAATAKFLVDSYQYIASGLSTTLHFLYPLFVSLIMISFFKEKKSIVLLLAALLSLIGVGLMCIQNDHSPALIKGLLLSLITVFTYGLYIVGLNKSSINTLNFHTLTFYVLLMGTVIFLLYCLIDGGVDSINLPADWINLVLLGVFATFISDLCLVLAVKHAGSTITSILGSMEPLVAVLIGTIFFNEYFTWLTALGVTFVLLSVTLVILFTKKHSS